MNSGHVVYACRYIMPTGDAEIKKRLAVSLGLLAGAKVLNVQVPFLFKYISKSAMRKSGDTLK